MDAKLKQRLAHVRNRHVFMLDLLFIVISMWGSFALAVGWSAVLPTYAPALAWMLALSLLVKTAVYYFFGLYRRLWVYASVNELKVIVIATTTASVLVGGMMLALFYSGTFQGFPRSTIGIDWLLSMLFVGGLRFSFRLLAESAGAAPARTGEARRVLVVGAGDAGALVARELQKNPQMNVVPVGFLDDDPAKKNHAIYGVRVIGALPDLADVLVSHRVHEVIIAIPSAPGRVVRLVSDVCRLKGVPFRTMPGLYELIGGQVSVSRLREVDIADLLRRQTVRIHEEVVAQTLGGKRILVTGAGGSIGREICRQVARWQAQTLVLLGHGENSIFEALVELRQDFPHIALIPVIADVRDAERMQAVFAEHRPQVVFHAAAHKHVPLMEANAQEAIFNNVIGTRNVVDAAVASGVERLVMISTDKAIHPVNVMGATKRLAEMLVLDAARQTGRAFSTVRFGNVLGSRGSVVPLFKQQIARGGPVTITHPDMRRYFMVIPEAVHLVLQAASMGQGADTFLLNMGEQVRIQDLAEDLIRLSGLEPGRDIEIVYTGVRPGEKLSEELFEAGQTYDKTAHPDIFRLGKEEDLRGGALRAAVDDLAALARTGTRSDVATRLDAIVPGASIQSNNLPDITSVV